MINIGEINTLKVIRTADFGYYLDAETGNTSEDVLLPIKSALQRNLEIGDEVDAFIYRDSSDRVIATLKMPLAKVGELAYLQVVSGTKIGSFINFGLERDILVPLKEQNYHLEVGKKYLFYIYLDKTSRIAATTFVERYLDVTEDLEIGAETSGTVYGYQTNGSIMLAIENKYKAVILRNEYFTQIKPGEVINVRVKKYYEDQKLEVTPRKGRLDEKEVVEQKILEYLKAHDGIMEYNDKSSPADIKRVFQSSKNYFKNALGGLMKAGVIVQDEEGTKLSKK